jgi:hypothetical protein
MAAWFMRSGQFKFNSDAWSDWLILGVLVFIAFSGVRLIYVSAVGLRSIVVRRSELVDLIAAARMDADISITNFAGDLSWLREDFETTKAIRNENATVKMEIYYDRSRTPASLSPLLDRYQAMGVKLIAYPDGIDPLLRCTLIDKESPSSRRMYVYARAPTSSLGLIRSEQLFTWQQLDPTDGVSMEATLDLINALSSLRIRPLIVGISGANNVGKTSIVRKVRELLEQRCSVTVLDDEFRVAATDSTKDDAYSTLCSQLVRLQSVNGDVCIIDRTPADNLCFLRLRSGIADKSYAILAPRISSLLRTFDLQFDVRRSEEAFDDDTKFVTGSDRKRVREYLDELFSNYGLNAVRLTTDFSKFDRSVELAAQTVADAVTAKLAQRRTS